MDDQPSPGAADQPGNSVAHQIAQATAQLRTEHKQETSLPQQLVDRLTALVGRPAFVALSALTIVVWVAVNLLASRFGVRPIDPPPFQWLQGVASTAALLIAAAILTTQRREDLLASHRDQLILELSVRNDQRTAKIIELLEETRRDNPAMVDRVDEQADEMSSPSDAGEVLEAVKAVQADIDSGG